MIENIKELYGQVLDKNKLSQEIADKFFLKIITIKNHWFSGVWSIPNKYQSCVFQIIKHHLENQIKEQTELLSIISQE